MGLVAASEVGIVLAADLVFSVLVFSYAVAMVYAWRTTSPRAPEEPRPDFRRRVRELDRETRPATTVTFFFSVSAAIGMFLGDAL